MKFSVIVPNYNGEKYIVDCLRSILADLAQCDELIVVDDCSTDDSTKLVSQIAAVSEIRIKLVKLTTNSGGPAKPRNIGVGYATGDVVCFFDNDDIWLSGRRELLSRMFMRGEQNIIFTKILDEDKLSSYDIKVSEKNVWISRVRLALLNELKLSTSAIKKKTFEAYEFNESKQFSAVEDFYLWLQMSKMERIKLNYSQTVWYRRHCESISANKIKQSKKVLKVYQYEFPKYWYLYFFIYVIRSVIYLLIRKIKN